MFQFVHKKGWLNYPCKWIMSFIHNMGFDGWVWLRLIQPRPFCCYLILLDYVYKLESTERYVSEPHETTPVPVYRFSFIIQSRTCRQAANGNNVSRFDFRLRIHQSSFFCTVRSVLDIWFPSTRIQILLFFSTIVMLNCTVLQYYGRPSAVGRARGFLLFSIFCPWSYFDRGNPNPNPNPNPDPFSLLTYKRIGEKDRCEMVAPIAFPAS